MSKMLYNSPTSISNSKIFPGVIPPDLRKKGRGGGERREGKEGEGREEMGNEGEGWNGGGIVQL